MRIGVVAIALALTVGLGTARAEGVVPIEGSWGGESSAGLPVHFGVEGGRVGQRRERRRVLTAVADTVCRRQIGSTCPPR